MGGGMIGFLKVKRRKHELDLGLYQFGVVVDLFTKSILV